MRGDFRPEEFDSKRSQGRCLAPRSAWVLVTLSFLQHVTPQPHPYPDDRWPWQIAVPWDETQRGHGHGIRDTHCIAS